MRGDCRDPATAALAEYEFGQGVLVAVAVAVAFRQPRPTVFTAAWLWLIGVSKPFRDDVADGDACGDARRQVDRRLRFFGRHR